MIIPKLQQVITNNTKNAKKGSFFRVNPRYSSKTVLAGKEFKNMHGKTEINQISQVYKGTKETRKTQKNVGKSTIKEKRSILAESLLSKPK